MKRRAMLGVLLAGCRKAADDAPIRLATLRALGHLPVAMAETLGFYRDESITVTLDILTNTSKASEALMAGSVDVITGAYDQTLQLAAEGRALRAFAVVMARDARAVVAMPGRSGISTVGDLKGKRLGVPGLGSGNHLFANYMLLRAGLRPEDVSVSAVGVGRSAIAALERGVVDAASVSTSTIFYLKAKYPGLVLLADASTVEGSKAVYGAVDFPVVALVARSEWLDQRPERARKLAKAVQRALRWLDDQTPEQIQARIPEGYLTGECEIDIASLHAMKSIWSKDGVMPPDGPETVRKVVALTNEKIRDGKIDLSKTYTNEFVKELR